MALIDTVNGNAVVLIELKKYPSRLQSNGMKQIEGYLRNYSLTNIDSCRFGIISNFKQWIVIEYDQFN